ncbi:MAG: SUF system Fe-S cluster assembly regulator [Xanthomonadales bacterium]|jgi:FeS assembly SUF system regulator|nr:SUF system Fe-S cluster assembly regulator [Xanthomonadales bacterium]
MLRISKLTDYAILVMVELTAHRDEVLSAQSLAERCGLEAPTVSKVLKALVRAGLVESFRGANGGYRAHGAPESVSIAAVIDAIEGPIAMTECSVHEGLCTVEASCSARDNWQKVSRAVAEALERVSLADMSRPADAGRFVPTGLEIATLGA